MRAITLILTLVGGGALAAPGAPAAAAVTLCDGNVATIVGTPHRDLLVGTPGADVIVARAGDDRIVGRGGDDVICAGAGRDRIEGGGGDDRLFAGPARVVLDRGRHVHPDSLDGGPGDDYFDIGWERVDQRSFDVAARIGFGRAPGGVTVDLAAGTATGYGSDTIVPRPGLAIFGSTHDDVLLGSRFADVIAGGDGDDHIEGRGNGDLLDGEEGRTRAYRGVSGDDTLLGGPGDDVLTAWRGSDVLRGGTGNDFVAARTREPSKVYGEEGSDHLVVTVTRNPGYVLDGGPGYDYGGPIAPGPAEDEIPNGVLVISRAEGSFTRRGDDTGLFAGMEELRIGDFIRANYYGTDDPDVVEGGRRKMLRAWTYGGDDRVNGSPRADLIDAGAGSDYVDGAAGHDICLNAERRRSCEELSFSARR